MRALVAFEERELRELVAFFLEGFFGIGIYEAGSLEEVTHVLNDEQQSFDILVCDYAKSAKPIISFALGKGVDLHFLCLANKTPEDPMILSRKEWVHFLPSTNIIGGIEAVIRKLFKEFQTDSASEFTEFCKIKPQQLLMSNPLKGNVYVRLSDMKYVRIMEAGLEFDITDFDYYCRKKKIETLYIKKQNCKDFAIQIQQTIINKLKESKVGNGNAFQTTGTLEKLTPEQMLEIKRKRLEYLKEKAKELRPNDAPAVEATENDGKEKPLATVGTPAKSLEEKRIAMIQAKAKEILDKKVKADELAATRPKVKDIDSLEKAKQEVVKKVALAKRLERELGAELEEVQEMSSKLGFTREVQKLTRQSVMETISVVRNAPGLSALLLQLRSEKEKYISSHSMLLAYVGCALASQMEWRSDTTYHKITLAAFLHDIVLKNQELARIQTLSELARKSSQFSKEDIRAFREHPNAAAEVARKFTEVPPDVDSIILQHHERPDGSGFPRGLTHLRIGPLATVFIVAHDLVSYLFDNEIGGDHITSGLNLDLFLEKNIKTYQFGNFKKILAVVPKIKS